MRSPSDQAYARALKRSNCAVPLPDCGGIAVERDCTFDQPPDPGASGHLTTIFRERCDIHRFGIESVPASLGAHLLNHAVVWRRLIPAGNDQDEPSAGIKEITESADGHSRPLKTYLALVRRDRFRPVDNQPDDIRSLEELKPIDAISVDELRGPLPREVGTEQINLVPLTHSGESDVQEPSRAVVGQYRVVGKLLRNLAVVPPSGTWLISSKPINVRLSAKEIPSRYLCATERYRLTRQPVFPALGSPRIPTRWT